MLLASPPCDAQQLIQQRACSADSTLSIVCSDACYLAQQVLEYCYRHSFYVSFEAVPE